jgi:hypothetical protein
MHRSRIPFNGERIDAMSTSSNDRSESIFRVKSIELRIQLGAIGIVTAPTDQNPHAVQSLLRAFAAAKPGVDSFSALAR